MNPLLASLIVLAALAGPATAAGPTGNRMEAFAPASHDADVVPEPGVGDPEHCTADRKWCAAIDIDEAGGATLKLYDGSQPEGARPILHPIGNEEGASHTVWPWIVRLAAADLPSNPPYGPGGAGEGLILGIEKHVSTGYSGGGASATTLSLLLATPDFAGGLRFEPVLDVPVGGSALIRACFSEEDITQRAGACHDEYTFQGRLTLEAGLGMPRFRYATQATSFPGNVSRYEDSLANVPLTERDLVRAVDRECSYRRLLRFNPATCRYEFDRPAPDCSAFTEP
ncbi:hypothetical protein [Lysobacter sp.]|uniref:hypothetical protein n=1 Tax=Lysobacter sp. TaxID=72226 RepID=UPI002D701691|nr:hypothetical protein [Lysobacter sp.]HZX76975.1 hypothetical protein [Lysobacter sp.]